MRREIWVLCVSFLFFFTLKHLKREIWVVYISFLFIFFTLIDLIRKRREKFGLFIFHFYFSFHFDLNWLFALKLRHTFRSKELSLCFYMYELLYQVTHCYYIVLYYIFYAFCRFLSMKISVKGTFKYILIRKLYQELGKVRIYSSYL